MESYAAVADLLNEAFGDLDFGRFGLTHARGDESLNT